MISMPLKTQSFKTIAMALCASLAISSALPTTMAQAGSRYYHDRGYHDYDRSERHHRRLNRKHRRNHKGDMIAAGLIGLAIGAIIADSAHKQKKPRPAHRPHQVNQQHPYYEPAYRHYEDEYIERRSLDDVQSRPYHAPVVTRERVAQPTKPDNGSDPLVITYEDAMSQSPAEPWTTQWYDYCTAKFRSFDPDRGTYLGYDGKRHFCVAK